MRIVVNLASEPFRRDRPILVASTLVGVLLAGVLVMLISLTFLERGEVAETRQAVDRLQGELRATAEEQSNLKATLQRPENAEALDLVLFINSLLYRKGISWTKIFSDLEGVVPYNVRLMSVRPQVNARNEISLDMVVGARSQGPVIQMLKRMESSRLFGATAVHTVLPPAETEPLYRYGVSVNYGQEL
jgi:type IV pilus assembly protein PilN